MGVEKTCKSQGLDGKTSWYGDNAWLVVYVGAYMNIAYPERTNSKLIKKEYKKYKNIL